MMPITNTVGRHPYTLMPQTIGGTNNPAILLPPMTIDIADARLLIIHAFTAVIDGVNPPTLNPSDSVKKAK